MMKTFSEQFVEKGQARVLVLSSSGGGGGWVEGDRGAGGKRVSVGSGRGKGRRLEL